MVTEYVVGHGGVGNSLFTSLTHRPLIVPILVNYLHKPHCRRHIVKSTFVVQLDGHGGAEPRL